MGWSRLPVRWRLALLNGLLIVALVALYYSRDEVPEGNPIAIDILRPFFGTNIQFYSVERTKNGEVILHGRVIDFSKVPAPSLGQLDFQVWGQTKENGPASIVIHGGLPFKPDPTDPKRRLIDIPLASSPISAPWLYWRLGYAIGPPTSGMVWMPSSFDWYMKLRTPNPGRSTIKRNFLETGLRQEVDGVEFQLDDFSDSKSVDPLTVGLPPTSSGWSGWYDAVLEEGNELVHEVTDWWNGISGISVVCESSVKVSATEPDWHAICVTAVPNLESPYAPYQPAFPIYWPEDGPYQIRALMVHYKVFSISEILALPVPPSGGSTPLHRSISWNGTQVDLDQLTWDEGKPKQLRLHFRAGALFCDATDDLVPALQSTKDEQSLEPFYEHLEYQTDDLGLLNGCTPTSISQVVRSSPGPSDTMATFDLVPTTKPVTQINLYVVDRAEVVTFCAQPRILKPK